MPLVSYIIERPNDVFDRHHRRFLNVAHRKAMETHRRVRMGKHFKDVPETAPGGPYGYVARSAKYLKRKQRIFGHTRPNLMTGQTKRITGHAPITATFKQATLTIRPNFQGRRDQKTLKKFRHNRQLERIRGFITEREQTGRENIKQRIAELEAITDQERTEIRDEMLLVYAGELNRWRSQRQRKHIRA